MSDFLYGADEQQLETPSGSIRVRIIGSGFPLLLPQDHPRTHTTWWQVAPLLGDRFTVVCADLPGFGKNH